MVQEYVVSQKETSTSGPVGEQFDQSTTTQEAETRVNCSYNTKRGKDNKMDNTNQPRDWERSKWHQSSQHECSAGNVGFQTFTRTFSFHTNHKRQHYCLQVSRQKHKTLPELTQVSTTLLPNWTCVIEKQGAFRDLKTSHSVPTGPSWLAGMKGPSRTLSINGSISF